MIGQQINKYTVDNYTVEVIKTLREGLDQAVQLKNWVDAQSDESLTALGYEEEDISSLREVATDLFNLRQTAYGQREQPGASNFFFHADVIIPLV